MPNLEDGRLLINYYSLGSTAKTIVSLFKRDKNQLTIIFDTWLSQEHFESYDEAGNPSAPYARLHFEFPITGSQFQGVMTQYADLFDALDGRVKAISKITDFDFYEIDVIEKIVTIMPSEDATEINPSLVKFTGKRFDAIMEDANNKPVVGNVIAFCWGYAAEREPYIKMLVAAAQAAAQAQ